MQIMTHLIYEDVFDRVEKSGLTLPLSCLQKAVFIDELIDELTEALDPVEVISYCSFLNMIVQTCEPDESARLGRKELAAVGISQRVADNKVFFHRDGLLYMIMLMIEKGVNRTIRFIPITGGEDKRGPMRYYKALLLINSKFNFNASDVGQRFLKDYVLREYPPSYSPEAVKTIYSNRMNRYWHLYNEILLQMEEREVICNAIAVLEKEAGLSLQNRFFVLSSVLNWFLTIPVEKRKGEIKGIKGGFDYRNIRSFYIKKGNFSHKDRLIRLIEHIAADLPILKSICTKSRKDIIQGLYTKFQSIFDRPVFKINENEFCILDLKFLLEGICSGFLWHLKEKHPLNNFPDLKAKYGHLLENYFNFLIEQIFKSATLSKIPQDGPDYIVESDNRLLIFEFTTEYYRVSSLYDTLMDSTIQDIHRLLFNQGKNDPYSRCKDDLGKFIKLDKYVSERGGEGKIVIPVLVTENYFGDYDLLNEFGHYIDNKIKEYELKSLQEHKPLILCLDDLEVFWALSDTNKALLEFVEYVRSWHEASKGPFFYNFSYFILDKNNNIVKNSDYSKFFNYSNLIKKLSANAEDEITHV